METSEMTFPGWKRRRRDGVDEETKLERAEERRDEVRSRWPAVRAAAQSMRKHLEEDDFAHDIEQIYLGRKHDLG